MVSKIKLDWGYSVFNKQGCIHDSLSCVRVDSDNNVSQITFGCDFALRYVPKNQPTDERSHQLTDQITELLIELRA